jgi:integrase
VVGNSTSGNLDGRFGQGSVQVAAPVAHHREEHSGHPPRQATMAIFFPRRTAMRVAHWRRSTLHSVFVQAAKVELWNGMNPVATVEPRTVAKRAYAALRAEEVPTLLSAIPENWRPLFACALYTALRRGELFGLRKADEICALLQVRKSIVYGACDRGALEYVRFEGAVQIEGRDFKRWFLSEPSDS